MSLKRIIVLLLLFCSLALQFVFAGELYWYPIPWYPFYSWKQWQWYYWYWPENWYPQWQYQVVPYYTSQKDVFDELLRSGREVTWYEYQIDENSLFIYYPFMQTWIRNRCTFFFKYYGRYWLRITHVKGHYLRTKVNVYGRLYNEKMQRTSWLLPFNEALGLKNFYAVMFPKLSKRFCPVYVEMNIDVYECHRMPNKQLDCKKINNMPQKILIFLPEPQGQPLRDISN